MIAVGTASGTVFVIEANVRSLKEKERVVLRMAEHRSSISAIIWNDTVRAFLFSLGCNRFSLPNACLHSIFICFHFLELARLIAHAV